MKTLTNPLEVFDKQLSPVNRRLIINALNVATGLPYNRLENEIGEILTFCLKNKYNNRCTLGACFGALWKRRYTIQD